MSTTTDTEILDRRHMLIAALKTGTYRQGFKALLNQNVTIEHIKGYPAQVAVPDTQRLCCLGVGMAIADDGWLPRGIQSRSGEYDPADDYTRVRELYGMEPKLMNYLMGMNDGDMVQYNKELIRHDETSRNFKFIARFLGIVWGLK